MHYAPTISHLSCLRDIRHLQTIAHNMTNLQTPGFKRHMTSSPQATLSEKTFDFKQGALLKSDNPTNLALQGTGFFKVQTPHGIAYTRLGNFHINQEGDVENDRGDYLIGKKGPIHLEEQNRYDTTWIQDIDPVTFDNLQQLKEQNGIFYTQERPKPCSPFKTKIIPGMMEQSNVDTLDEMLDLSQTMGHLQRIEQLLTLNDTLLTKAINQLGNVYA